MIDITVMKAHKLKELVNKLKDNVDFYLEEASNNRPKSIAKDIKPILGGLFVKFENIPEKVFISAIKKNHEAIKSFVVSTMPELIKVVEAYESLEKQISSSIPKEKGITSKPVATDDPVTVEDPTEDEDEDEDELSPLERYGLEIPSWAIPSKKKKSKSSGSSFLS